MNIVKLQNDLKAIPVDTLIQYVQGMNPEVPSYLALAEIKSRKDMEAKYAAQNQKAPESSVAEDLTQMPNQGGLQMLAGNPMGNQAQQMPQGAPADQGVAGLDTGDMYNEQNFAGGGIVAFADGGDTGDHLNMTELPVLNLNTGTQSMGGSGMGGDALYSFNDKSAFAPVFKDIMAQMSPSDRAKFIGSGMGTFMGLQERPKQEYYTSSGDVVSRYADGGMVAFADGGKVPSFAGPSGSYINPEMAYNDPALMAQYQEYLKAHPIYVRDPQTGFKAFMNDLNKTSEIMRTPLSPSFLSQVGLAGLKTGESAMADTAQKAKERYFGGQPTISSAPTTVPGAEVLGSQASADRLSNPMYTTDYARAVETAGRKQPTQTNEVPASDVTKPVGLGTPGIDSLLEDTTGLAEKKMARYNEMMGTNPERARLEELTRKYETGAAEQERTAPWMALAKAGFSMAGGKSPYAIQNLSEGAVAGLADYAQAKDRLDKLNEKQIDIRSKLLQVDEARKSAAVTYGVNSEEHAAARNAQVKLKDMEEKNAFERTKYAADISTKNAMIAAAKKSDYETFMDLAKKDDDNYKTVKDKDGNTQKVFDASKVTQVWKSFSGSSGLDDDKLLAAWQQEKLMNPKFNMSLQDYIAQMRNKSPGTPAATSSSTGWGNLRTSSK